MDCAINRFVPDGSCLLYLDTSAVFGLGLKRQGPLPVQPAENVQRLIELFRKLPAANSGALFSILAIEEIGAKTRNNFRRKGAEDAGYARDWDEFKLVKPEEARVVQQRAQTAMLNAMQSAVDALHEVGATFAHPKSNGTPEDAKRVRKGHRSLLRENPGLDAMDALHIVFGWELHCTHFVSFDNGWKGIGKINLIHH